MKVENKNGVRIVRVEGFAGQGNYGHYEDCPLADYELKLLKGKDVFIYWYGEGNYCGVGYAIWRTNGKWYGEDLSHCSCYGPLEGVILNHNDAYLADKLEDVKARGTNDWWFKNAEVLVDKARSLRYK